MDAVSLKNGSWQVKVLPDHGMNMISVQVGGRELMRCPDSRQTLEHDPMLHGFPIIMPANRTKDGVFAFRGKTYRLPINEVERGNNLHGQMRDAPFTVLEQSQTHLAARFENRGERYPFSFDMTIEDTVTARGVERKTTIKALEDMPFTFGFHATFVQPVQYSVPRKKQCIWNERLIPTGEWIDPEPLPETFDVCFSSSGSTVELDDIRFTVSDTFDHWVMYNADGKQGYLCVEPQCGQVNGLNSPDGHRVLQAGEEMVFRYCVTRAEDRSIR